MKDLIYRQDAIEALEEVDWYHQNKDKDMVLGANPSEHQAWYKEDDIFKTLEALPSAQPEQTDCEYCHEDSDGYVRPIEKNSHAWLVRRGRTIRLRVCFKGGYSECDILFCPMCGRRFVDE